MPYVCHGHKSLQKLYNLNSDKHIILTHHNEFYDYTLGVIKAIYSDIYPKNIIDFNYSEITKRYHTNHHHPKLIKTDSGHIYLWIPFSRPIFLLRRENLYAPVFIEDSKGSNSL